MAKRATLAWSSYGMSLLKISMFADKNGKCPSGLITKFNTKIFSKIKSE